MITDYYIYFQFECLLLGLIYDVCLSLAPVSLFWQSLFLFLVTFATFISVILSDFSLMWLCWEIQEKSIFRVRFCGHTNTFHTELAIVDISVYCFYSIFLVSFLWSLWKTTVSRSFPHWFLQLLTLHESDAKNSLIHKICFFFKLRHHLSLKAISFFWRSMFNAFY